MKQNYRKGEVRRKHGRHYRRKQRRRTRILRNLLLAFCIVLLALLAAVLIKVLAFPDAEQNEKDPGSGNAVNDIDRADEEQKSTAVITLDGGTAVEIKLGEGYTDPGYSAQDADGTDLTDQVQVDTSALNRAGEQQVIYTVKDSLGREMQAVRNVTVLPNTEYETPGLPICMYHYVYDPASPPENLDSNYISTDSLAEEMKYLHDNGYYFPTWQEVRDYVDGKLLLPEKSIVLTFDDGPNYMYLGTPILEQYQTPATSFVITSYWNDREMLYGYSSDYLTFESHSHKMHQGGGSIGHGGIYTAMSREEVLADLEKSFEICGNKDAFAYPFGDYTEEGCSTLEEAGLLCAVTTENAKCYPGDNPYLLPRVRMLGSQTLEAFVSAIN